jgi:HNH endonuclease
VSDQATAFWARVDQSGGPTACWPWTGPRTPQGYGRYSVHQIRQRAHRYALLFSGWTIPPGLLVCHHCDNPPCCNPSHLYVGTYADNNRDKARRGHLPPQNLRATHCRRGHAFAGTNLHVRPRDSAQVCRQCRREWTRATRMRQRARIGYKPRPQCEAITQTGRRCRVTIGTFKWTDKSGVLRALCADHVQAAVA